MKAFTHDIPGTPASAWDELVAALPVLDLSTDLTVLAAHPDDETLGVGGLVSTARSVTVVIASDGAASHPESPTHSRADLARVRREEAAAAVAALHPGAVLRLLDLPDGGLSAHVHTIAAALSDTDGALVSTWLGDGHPDHEACARAARRVAATTNRRLLEYPIWAWLWADPSGADLPCDLRRFDLPARAVEAKRGALACYPSQTGPLSDRPGDEAVLTERFLAHFARPSEVLVEIDSAPAATSCSDLEQTRVPAVGRARGTASRPTS